MQTSTLRDRVRRELIAFAWDQWAQLGVFASTNRNDRWAADPEALLLFTFEVGRNEPRLFDETLDWLLTNAALVSVQRLRNLCLDDDDRDLADAALAWVARQRPRSRFVARRRSDRSRQPRPLFRTVAQEVRNPDEAFLSVGLLKPDTERSGKSRQPDLDAPISFAFRMRHLFGLGTRAEIVRYFVTAPLTDAPAQLVAEAAAYAKRNVHETLASLVACHAATTFELGNERRYYFDRGGWGQLLGLRPDTWPTYREWPRLLGALRRLVRWLEEPELDRLSPYMLASEARTLMEELESDFAFAGVALSGAARAQGEGYWDYFVESVDRTLATLSTGWA